MKIRNTFDFNSQLARQKAEKNDAGEYLVHLEDYESLNDLIRRSIRTKTRFVPETNKNAVYDDFLDDPEALSNLDRFEEPDVEAVSANAESERSEATAKPETAESVPPQIL